MVRHQKKRSFILLEMLIALSLTAILLTFLFSFFVESARIEKKLDIARMEINHRSHLQTRLQAVFSALDYDPLGFALYTQKISREKGMSLIVVFDQGVDPEPAYSGTILGRLFIDADKNLCLATWPLDLPKNGPWRQEILLPHIEDFEWEFLGKISATEHAKKEKIRPITPTHGWRTAWSKTHQEPPSIIRLTVWEEKQKEPLRFAFILPVLEPFVTYQEAAI